MCLYTLVEMTVGGHTFLHFYLAPSPFSPFCVPPTLYFLAQIFMLKT